jgi:hypothetical protein
MQLRRVAFMAYVGAHIHQMDGCTGAVDAI